MCTGGWGVGVLLSTCKMDLEIIPKWHYLSIELHGIVFQHDQ